MTIKQLAVYFGVPRKQLYFLAKNREAIGFPVVKVGGAWIADAQQVKNWMVECAENNVRPLEIAKQLVLRPERLRLPKSRTYQKLEGRKKRKNK